MTVGMRMCCWRYKGVWVGTTHLGAKPSNIKLGWYAETDTQTPQETEHREEGQREGLVTTLDITMESSQGQDRSLFAAG